MEDPDSPLPRVVVIGAGVAGVSTALRLIHNGISNVTVLEAQDYIGGRVKSVEIDGKPADLGAQFIHGRVGNPVYDIASKLNRIPFEASKNRAEETLINPSKLCFTSSGQKVQEDKVDDLVSILSGIDEESDADGHGFTMEEAIDNVFKNFLSEKEGLTEPALKHVYDAVVKWFKKYVQVDNACADLTKMARTGSYVVLPGERFVDVDQGMTGILETLSAKLPKGTVKLNAPVSGIEWGDQTNSSKSAPICVSYGEGKSIDCDHVVVTVSIGCLKATHARLFQPSLPLPMQMAIENTGFGGIGKIYLLFDNPWWEQFRPSDGDSFDSESDDDDFFDSFEFLWIESSMPTIKGDRCQKMTKFGKPWWYGIHSIETVHDFPNLLEIWLTHDQLEVCEGLGDHEVMSVCTQVLRTFITEAPVPDPVAVYRTSWLSNPYTRGTYTYCSVNSTQQDKDILGMPLPHGQDPKVLFAGEAYSREFSSTFHGALISGSDTAGLILTKHGIHAQKEIIDLI